MTSIRQKLQKKCSKKLHAWHNYIKASNCLTISSGGLIPLPFIKYNSLIIVFLVAINKSLELVYSKLLPLPGLRKVIYDSTFLCNHLL